MPAGPRPLKAFGSAIGRPSPMYWEEEGFKALITWGNSAAEHTEWEYSCFYHDEDHTLVSMPFGTRTEVVYDENGEQTSATEVYNDGSAVFSLDEEAS